MDILFDILKDKKAVIKFLMDSMSSNEKQTVGLRKLKESTDVNFKIDKLLEVTANQSAHIKTMSLILLVYAQSSDFDMNVAQMLNKMGRGEEALKQMFKNKLEGR